MRRAHIAAEQHHHQHHHNNHSHQNGDILEDENERLTDGLQGKVKALKSLSIDIGAEVRTQNKLLNEMDDEFDKSGGFLRATMNRVSALARAGHNRYILYLLLFALAVFFVCWIIIKTR